MYRFEDVGLASLEVVELVTVSLGGKQARAALGGEWATASRAVSDIAKPRSARRPKTSKWHEELHSAYAEARAELPRLTTRDLITNVTWQGAVQGRALALVYALGTARHRSSLVSRRGEPRVFDHLCEAG